MELEFLGANRHQDSGTHAGCLTVSRGLDLAQRTRIDDGGTVIRFSHPTLEEIHIADEIRDETVAGTLVQFGRRRYLKHLALRHDRDAIRHRERLFLVVGNKDERDADRSLQVPQLKLHLFAQFLVERAQRFVE